MQKKLRTDFYNKGDAGDELRQMKEEMMQEERLKNRAVLEAAKREHNLLKQRAQTESSWAAHNDNGNFSPRLNCFVQYC